MGEGMKHRIGFWYEFASTYSYLSAMRIEDEAARAGVDVEWRPFLLGPIFKANGWTTSPFNVYPAKGRYMQRDIARIAESRGLPFKMPETFPANGLKAARLAIAAKADGGTARFTRAVYAAAFGRGLDVFDDAVLTACLIDAGLDPDAMNARANAVETKTALRNNTDEAIARGIFGAPSFTTDDNEMFWGDDRLDQALAWTAERTSPKS
jgi:2-hydroxychromene-2-carboxylate isomerase